MLNLWSRRQSQQVKETSSTTSKEIGPVVVTGEVVQNELEGVKRTEGDAAVNGIDATSTGVKGAETADPQPSSSSAAPEPSITVPPQSDPSSTPSVQPTTESPTVAEAAQPQTQTQQPQVSLVTPSPAPRQRRISFRSFGFFYGRDKPAPADHSTLHNSETHLHLTPSRESQLKEEIIEAHKKRKLISRRNEKKVDKTAFALRNLILGPAALNPIPEDDSVAVKGEKDKRDAAAKPAIIQPVKPVGQATLNKVNGQLLVPKQANKVIAKLRTLPVPEPPSISSPNAVIDTAPPPQSQRKGQGEAPIHAVCLDCTEIEAEQYHFARLAAAPEINTFALPTRSSSRQSQSRPSLQQARANQPVQTVAKTSDGKSDPPSIAAADITTLVPVLRDLKIVTLVSSPDLGISQPVGGYSDGEGGGLLAGAVPSPVVVGEGLKEITSQLMALGFATSKMVFPDHQGVYPPLDRMSVLTYWWGLEVCLPPPTMVYLANVKSIQNAALNFLTAFALFSNGVRELLPFVRYISQFLDFQWGAIKAQDRGQGVVCAATWVMPAALVPRSWDFPPPPPEKLKPNSASMVSAPQQPSSPNNGSNPLPPPTSSNGPTIAFPGGKQGLFTPNAPVLPPVMITPATLPRGAMGISDQAPTPQIAARANPFPLK